MSIGEGQDCTLIKGADTVGCVHGKCVIGTCEFGYYLDAEGPQLSGELNRLHLIRQSRADSPLATRTSSRGYRQSVRWNCERKIWRCRPLTLPSVADELSAILDATG